MNIGRADPKIDALKNLPPPIDPIATLGIDSGLLDGGTGELLLPDKIGKQAKTKYCKFKEADKNLSRTLNKPLRYPFDLITFKRFKLYFKFNLMMACLNQLT